MKKLILFVSMLVLTLGTKAQTVEEKPALKGENSEALAAVRLANDLLRYGYTNQSTLALIDALQIFSENPTQRLNVTREGSEVDESKMEGKKPVRLNLRVIGIVHFGILGALTLGTGM